MNIGSEGRGKGKSQSKEKKRQKQTPPRHKLRFGGVFMLGNRSFEKAKSCKERFFNDYSKSGLYYRLLEELFITVYLKNGFTIFYLK